jgi:hypothetical protein
MKIELVETKKIILKPGKVLEMTFPDEKYLIMIEILSGLGVATKKGRKIKGEKNTYLLDGTSEDDSFFEHLCGTYIISAKTTLKLLVKKIDFRA